MNGGLAFGEKGLINETGCLFYNPQTLLKGSNSFTLQATQLRTITEALYSQYFAEC